MQVGMRDRCHLLRLNLHTTSKFYRTKPSDAINVLDGLILLVDAYISESTRDCNVVLCSEEKTFHINCSSHSILALHACLHKYLGCIEELSHSWVN